MEKKVFPREKTCGDGLTPRAVRQIADMGLEGALAGAHRYNGLRAHAFGRVLDLPWPVHLELPRLRLRHHPPRPRRHRSTSGRPRPGATVWQGTEAVSPILDGGPGGGDRRPPAARLHRGGGEGEGHRHHPRGAGPLRGGGRRLQLPIRPGPGHQPRPLPADGDGPAGLLHLPGPRRPVHRVPSRHPGRRGQRGPRLRVDLPAGGRSGERGGRPALHRPTVEGHQHLHPDGLLRGLGAPASGSCPRRPAWARPPAASCRWA